MSYFDIILGMTYLSPYYAMLNCYTKSVTLEIRGRKKLEREGVYKLNPSKSISSIQIGNWWCSVFFRYLDHIQNFDVESPSIEFIHVV